MHVFSSGNSVLNGTGRNMAGNRAGGWMVCSRIPGLMSFVEHRSGGGNIMVCRRGVPPQKTHLAPQGLHGRCGAICYRALLLQPPFGKRSRADVLKNLQAMARVI